MTINVIRAAHSSYTYTDKVPVESVPHSTTPNTLIALVAQEIAPVDSPELTQYLHQLVVNRELTAKKTDSQATRGSKETFFNRNNISRARQGYQFQRRPDLD